MQMRQANAREDKDTGLSPRITTGQIKAIFGQMWPLKQRTI